jgi:hypothetical protein
MLGALTMATSWQGPRNIGGSLPEALRSVSSATSFFDVKFLRWATSMADSNAEDVFVHYVCKGHGEFRLGIATLRRFLILQATLPRGLQCFRLYGK